MANTLYADSYAIVGFKLGQRRGRGWSWFVEGRNLTDENYAATTGVIADARGMDSAQFLPGQGFSVYAGLEWKR
jgi:iron complex outermembrane receptor protein